MLSPRRAGVLESTFAVMLVPSTLKYNNTSEPSNSYPVTVVENELSLCVSIAIWESSTSSGRIPSTTVFPLYPPSASFLDFAGGYVIVVTPKDNVALSPSTAHFASMKFI